MLFHNANCVCFRFATPPSKKEKRAAGGDGINVECQANEVTSNWGNEGYGNGAEIRKMRYLMWITPLWPQGYCSAQESRPRPSIIVIAGTNVNFQFKCKYQFVNAALWGDFEGKKKKMGKASKERRNPCILTSQAWPVRGEKYSRGLERSIPTWPWQSVLAFSHHHNARKAHGLHPSIHPTIHPCPSSQWIHPRWMANKRRWFPCGLLLVAHCRCCFVPN